MKILVIGGGNMGLTYAQSFLRSHITTPEHMMILEKSPRRAAELAKRNVGTVFGAPDECLPAADIVILAVKPQDCGVLFERLRPFTDPQQVYLSIMAGVTIRTIQRGLGIAKVIRAMPNLPAQIGLGMTCYVSSEAVTRVELVMVQNLLNTTGKTVYVSGESSIDAGTAISGSGPAYVWYFMNAMMEAARGMGFSTSEAELLVKQTFRGAVELYNKSEYDCTEWIQRVKSRGGTTEAALDAYADQTVHEAIVAGAQAALARAVELGKVK